MKAIAVGHLCDFFWTSAGPSRSSWSSEKPLGGPVVQYTAQKLSGHSGGNSAFRVLLVRQLRKICAAGNMLTASAEYKVQTVHMFMLPSLNCRKVPMSNSVASMKYIKGNLYKNKSAKLKQRVIVGIGSPPWALGSWSVTNRKSTKGTEKHGR